MPRISGREALTFDDVLLIPGYSETLPQQVSVKTELVKGISLNIPFLSAAMDTVTESKMAITLAQLGGIGVIHKNMTVARQAEQVRATKRYETRVIRKPVTIAPERSVADLIALTKQHSISGVPVVSGKDLVGIVTNRDFRFASDQSAQVASIMTPRKALVTVTDQTSESEVLSLLQRYRLEKLLVVGEEGQLRGMVTLKDINNARMFPDASRDAESRLRTAAAVGVAAGEEERIEALVDAGADVLVVDTAHGHSKGVLERLRWIVDTYPSVPVIAGNVATADGAQALADNGASAVKVGIGPGSICTTRIVTGVGIPQITAIMSTVRGLKERGIPVIADGGVRYSGDLAKALAAGASAVMIGGLLAGTDEAPGEVELYQGRAYKGYRGMGSLSAMNQGTADRYFQEETPASKLIPEGVEGRVPYRGSVRVIVEQLVGGLRSAMGYTGCADMEEMRTKPKFMRTTMAGMAESHVHDVSVTREAPNYPTH